MFEPGKYQVRASTGEPGRAAYTTFEVVDLFTTKPASMLYLGIAFFIGLMFIISRGIVINASISEILRFICITGIAATPIAAFALTDVEVGTTAPVGLVKRPPLDEKGEPKWEDPEHQIPEYGGDWIINVGGTMDDYFTRGIQIPVNVFIFGIAGGYLRYLWKTAKLKSSNANVLTGYKGDKTIIRTWLFYQSLEDLALLFLSPLLAIAVWFVLFEGGTTGNYAIAVISFTVGLITEEVIQALIGFSGSILGRKDTEKNRVKNKTKVTSKRKKNIPFKV